jgi:hypothetical protein
MMRHGVAGRRLVLGLGLMLLLLGGCAEIGATGAKMHGLKVVDTSDCRHAFHTNPCTTVEDKQ